MCRRDQVFSLSFGLPVELGRVGCEVWHNEPFVLHVLLAKTMSMLLTPHCLDAVIHD